jgi:RNA recognition motif-containing protein
VSSLFISNIPTQFSETQLEEWLERQGFRTRHVQIVRDSHTGESRGFGFVELRHDWEIEDAIRRLNQKSVGNKRIVVTVAVPSGSNRKSESQFPRPDPASPDGLKERSRTAGTKVASDGH